MPPRVVLVTTKKLFIADRLKFNNILTKIITESKHIIIQTNTW